MHFDGDDCERRKRIEGLISQAKAGSIDAQGVLLDECREQLRRWASQMVSPQLRAKCAPSDIIQETAIDACRDFTQFKGEHLEELFAWLRAILLDNAIAARRRYEGAAKRQLSREVSLEATTTTGDRLSDDAPSPRSVLGRIEKQDQLQQALQRLSEDHRTVILLRSRDHLSFAEIGLQMQRSTEAARKLWFRAVEQLRCELISHKDAT